MLPHAVNFNILCRHLVVVVSYLCQLVLSLIGQCLLLLINGINGLVLRLQSPKSAQNFIFHGEILLLQLLNALNKNMKLVVKQLFQKLDVVFALRVAIELSLDEVV